MPDMALQMPSLLRLQKFQASTQPYRKQRQAGKRRKISGCGLRIWLANQRGRYPQRITHTKQPTRAALMYNIPIISDGASSRAWGSENVISLEVRTELDRVG